MVVRDRASNVEGREQYEHKRLQEGTEQSEWHDEHWDDRCAKHVEDADDDVFTADVAKQADGKRKRAG